MDISDSFERIKLYLLITKGKDIFSLVNYISFVDVITFENKNLLLLLLLLSSPSPKSGPLRPNP